MGLYGENYFMIPSSDLTRFRRLFEECSNKDLMDIPCKKLPIAYLKLLTAMVSVLCFSGLCPGRIVRLNCDNTNALTWLQTSRCPARIGFRMLSVIELVNTKFSLRFQRTKSQGQRGFQLIPCPGEIHLLG